MNVCFLVIGCLVFEVSEYLNSPDSILTDLVAQCITSWMRAVESRLSILMQDRNSGTAALNDLANCSFE